MEDKLINWQSIWKHKNQNLWN